MFYTRSVTTNGPEKWEQENLDELANLTDIAVGLQKEISQKTTLLELTKKERLLSVKNLISRKVEYNMLWSYAKNNLNKNKLSKDFPIQDYLRELFRDDKIIFDGVQTGGWTGYYFNICFSSHNKKFQLTVPTMDMKVEDLIYCSDGKLSIALDKGSVVEHFEASYDFDNIEYAYKKELARKEVEGEEKR